jgi:hypothetical protein
VTLAVGHAHSGAVLGASTAMALHSLCVIPQLVGAMILTSNRGFAEWGDVFGDPVVAKWGKLHAPNWGDSAAR